MGAWGYTPFDNDDAQDFLRRLYEMLNEGLDSDDSNTNWVAIELVLRMPLDPKVVQEGDLLTLALYKARELLDSEWMYLWKDPDKIEARLLAQIQTLKKRGA